MKFSAPRFHLLHYFAGPCLLLVAALTPAQTHKDGPDWPPAERPAPLELIPPRTEIPGLRKWLGNPEYRSSAITKTQWLADGSKLFSQASGLCVWQNQEEPKELRLLGSLPLRETWDVSPDGRWLCAHKGLAGELRCFNARTFEGVWALSVKVQFAQACFSPDGNVLALVHNTSTGRAVTLLDAATGKQLHQLHYVKENQGTIQYLNVAFGTGCLYLCPALDPEERIMRLSLNDWKLTPVSPPIASPYEMKLIVSRDERWLVLWDDSQYEVYENSAGGFVPRFKGDALDSRCGRFNSISLAPNAISLVISGGNSHKVIRLEDQKILHQDDNDCLCGTFAPDGKTLWRTCNPFRPVDPSSWKTRPDLSVGHRAKVNHLAFSPDGTRIASSDATSINVWRLNGTAPDYRFASPEHFPMGEFVWSPNGTEIYGADSRDFYRWKTSGPPSPTGAPPVPGKLLVSQPVESLHGGWTTRRIQIDPATGLCLFSANLSWKYTDLRHPSRPDVVRELKYAQGDKAPVTDSYFIRGGKELLYYSDGTFYAYNLTDDTIRRSTEKLEGSLLGHASKKNLIAFLGSRSLILLDDTTFAKVAEYFPPPKRSWPHASYISADGRWIVCQMSGNLDGSIELVLLDLEKKVTAATLPLRPAESINTATFSPDGNIIALGHTNGTVSLWKVADLVAAGSATATPLALTKAPPTFYPAPGSGSTMKMEKWPATMPPEPFTLKSGGTWMFSPDGSVKGDRLDAGQWLINGIELKQHRVDSSYSFNDAISRVAARVELRDPQGPLRILRYLHGESLGSLTWRDVVENLGLTPIEFTATFHSFLGEDVAGLGTPQDLTPQILEGYLTDETKISQLTAIHRQDESTQVTSITYGTPSASLRPRFRWDAAKSAVQSEWKVRLEPFQRIRLIHMLTQSASPGKLPRDEVLRMSDQSHRVISTLGSSLFLFANVSLEESTRARWREQYVTQFGLAEDGSSKDGFGFKWRFNDSILEGMSTEFGASHMLRLFVDGAPFFSTELAVREAPEVKPPCIMTEGRWKSGNIGIQRRSHWAKAAGTYASHDTVINRGTENQQANVEFAVIGSQDILALSTPDGRKLDPANPVLPPEAKGWIAVTFPGTVQPTVLLRIGTPEGRLRPSLHVIANRGLFLRYSLTLKPGESVPLVHAVAPRPLQIFDDVGTAIASLPATSALEWFPDWKLAAPAN